MEQLLGRIDLVANRLTYTAKLCLGFSGIEIEFEVSGGGALACSSAFNLDSETLWYKSDPAKYQEIKYPLATGKKQSVQMHWNCYSEFYLIEDVWSGIWK